MMNDESSVGGKTSHFDDDRKSVASKSSIINKAPYDSKPISQLEKEN